MTMRKWRFFLCALAASFLLTSEYAWAQYNERPDQAGSGNPAVDCSGRSIKNKRVRAIHTTDPELLGGTAYMIFKDPYLAYQLGRNLCFREFRDRDGVFDVQIGQLGGPMPDGTTAKITANNQTSCSGCHNIPQGNPGGGTNFHKDSGLGRNTPAYYGAGIIEMLALQVRADMMHQLDLDNDGWVNAIEAHWGGPNIYVQALPGGFAIDFGNPALSNGTTGKPSLNNIFKVWYVDQEGKVVPGVTEVDGVKTFGYNFEMIVWGWGQGAGRNALNPTNRAFLWDPFKAHGGLEAYDPCTNNDPDGDGISESTLAGAVQFPVSHMTPDEGIDLDPLGFSRDDPDGDGYLTEISEGDLDLGEWFMLNLPKPAFAGTPGEYQSGLLAMNTMGCTRCHVPDWEIRDKDDVFAGDRRFFDLDVRWNAQQKRLEGDLVPLFENEGDSYVRDLGSYRVVGLFTDLKHHDMGKGFKEIDFGGNVNTIWRTPPLWGVGSGFPWGHDGHSLSIEDAILRHDGEGLASKEAWQSAPATMRNDLLNMLQKMVLYDIETLPSDINGDGIIEDHFIVAGKDTDVERFNAEWLFKTPVQIQGRFVNTDGVTINSFAAMNVDEAYGQRLFLRRDSDDDGWPDVWDHEPTITGYKDGVE
ncbi:MAG: di-heme oxidoredictase family protein [Planctomycetota bacterium]